MRGLFLACFLMLPFFMFSQEAPAKKFDHYAGVQINQLIKEIINLSTNDDFIDNPYLLEYTGIHNKTNFGINLGFGYDYIQNQDHENPDAAYLEQHNLSFYIGICKRQFIGSKFELTYGLDYVNSYFSNKSYSNTVNDFGTITDSSYFQVTDESKSQGAGIDITFRYSISKRILLGTQLNYNFIWTKEMSHSLTYNTTTNSQTETTTNSLEVLNEGSDNKDFTLHLPLAVFLIFKF